MVRFIDLKLGDKLYTINLENKKLKLFVIKETPYIYYYKVFILPIMSYSNNEYSAVILINLDKIKQSIFGCPV